MSKRSHSFRKRKGLSEMVGAVFIIALIGASAAFALTMFSSFTSYQNAVNQRAKFNSELPRETLSFNKVFFGGAASFAASGLPTPFSPTRTPANFYPVTNMNFTSNSAGWTFTFSYKQTNVHGMSGAFDSTATTGSSSGPGSVFTDFTYDAGTTSAVEGFGTWTTEFTISSAELSALQSGTASISFSVGDELYRSVSPKTTTSLGVTFSIQDAENPSGAGSTVQIGTPTPTCTYTGSPSYCPNPGPWTFSSYGYPGGLAAQQTFFTSHNGGVYNLILTSDILLKGQATSAAEQRIYFDDTGVLLTSSSWSYSQLCPSFAITGPNPAIVQDMLFNATTTYSQPTTQTIYLWDFAQGAFTQVDFATVGTGTTTRTFDLASFVGGAVAVQRFIATSTSKVPNLGCGTQNNVPVGTVVMEVLATVTGSLTGTLVSAGLTAYYTDTGHVSMNVFNGGTETLHLVSLWITSSSGATQFASSLGGSSKFDVWVAPGMTAAFTVSFSWSSGQYTFELVSSRGNIFSDVVAA